MRSPVRNTRVAIRVFTTESPERRERYENRLARTIEQLLEKTAGPGKVRAEVFANMDFDRINTSEEVFDPDGQVVRSTQAIEESANNREGGGDRRQTPKHHAGRHDWNAASGVDQVRRRQAHQGIGDRKPCA